MNAPAIEKPDATTLMIRRTFDADVETLWRALTDPLAWTHWFGGGYATPVATSADLRPGGDWRIEMKGNDTGESHVIHGKFVEIDPPRRVTLTWAWQSAPAHVSEVAYVLSPGESDGQTTLILTHRRFADANARDAHGRGWTASLERLAAHLAN